jgi:arsenical pump membrane protein
VTDTKSSTAPAFGAPRRRPSAQLLGWLLCCAGAAAALAAVAIAPGDARPAAAQDWPPFVLVTGLLLVGLVSGDDGLFAAAGWHLARAARRGSVLFAGAAAMIGVVTALLNLDTSVAFLTPVLVYTARSRGSGEVPLLQACLLLSNAGSLLLPGSNLTNLIVLGQEHMTGGRFLARMWLPWLAALVVTGAVIAVAGRRSLRAGAAEPGPAPRAVYGLGLTAVVLATAAVILLGSPALPVAAIGATAIGVRLWQRRARPGAVAGVLGVPVLTGLFGLAVALGTVGRAWSGPAILMSHLDAWGTAALGAAAAVVVNNLPAASLLAARPPGHPFALLVGLNLGPNLFVTGSLAWFLWLRAARTAGASPSVAATARIGALAVPLSMAAALGALALTGTV